MSKNTPIYQQIVDKARKPLKIQMYLQEKHPKKSQEERRNLENGLPMEVRQTLSIEPDGIYEALATFMKENQEWQIQMWGIQERLVIVTVYGCKNIGPWKQRQKDLTGKIAEAIKKVLGKGKDGDGDEMEKLMADSIKNPGTRAKGKPLQEVWALVVLLEGGNEQLLQPQNQVTYMSVNTAVIFLEFPWEIPTRQHYMLSKVPPHLTGEQVMQHL